MRITTENTAHLKQLLSSKTAERRLDTHLEIKKAGTEKGHQHELKTALKNAHQQKSYLRKIIHLFAISLILVLFFFSYTLDLTQGSILAQLLLTLTASILLGKLIMRIPLL